PCIGGFALVTTRAVRHPSRRPLDTLCRHMAARRDNSGSKTVRQSPRGRAAGRSPGLAAGSRYWFASSRPLHILAFLAPLIVLYEIGSARYLNHEGARQSIL